MSPTQLPRYWRTAKHLRWSQITWRARRLAQRWTPTGSHAERVDDLADVMHPALPPLTRAPGFDARLLAEELALGNITLLNEQKRLGTDAVDWRCDLQREGRLWNITLQYHRWLYCLAEAGDTEPAARGLLRHYVWDWLRQCEAIADCSGSMAWSAYAIATRLEWWARIIARLTQSSESDDQRLAAAMRRSAARQALYLHRHVEWDLRANHLIRDCVGLAMASLLFTGPKPREWAETAKRVVLEQAREQVLSDGGHFERSPMYHLEIAEDFALLHHCFADDPQAAEVLGATLNRMAEFAAVMQHPDGRTPQLNDCSRRPVGETLAVVEAITGGAHQSRPAGLHHFSETGIVAWHGTQWSIFFDVGAVGPDYQPGHAHADTLTVEASFQGVRMLIDPGVGRYELNAERAYDRSTAAHNTVAIDQCDSSEVWHVWRVGRRAYPREVAATLRDGGFVACALHDGYDHLPGRPRHRRHVELQEGEQLVIVDDISGERGHQVAGQWLLEPEWRVTPSDQGWMCFAGDRCVHVTVECDRPLRIELEPALCHFEFGHDATTHRLRWRYEGNLPLTVRTIFSPVARP